MGLEINYDQFYGYVSLKLNQKIRRGLFLKVWFTCLSTTEVES